MARAVTTLVFLLSVMAICLAQRPGYAGTRPFGYPVIITTTTSTVAPPIGAQGSNGIGDRFGQDQLTTSTTTQRLPIEANGNQDLINYLSSLPRDQQPFWFLNWQAMEQHRNQPHSFVPNPNGYIDFASQGTDRKLEILPDYSKLFDDNK